ncbi:aspartic peptidase domain-containing protein [Kockovaella imperatae]|uniref:Aspartic peptidase domain-containing protein n=1 Tax=Kockovaella imperatae TaxID=4999 RepID=A0A1Y1UCZ3_9TREE|nr:aspartic peptidase domain-containing protein [Kockovaella imperatae]ORX35386.1 aspartic peptidase domain-containing protein [Kockovaella imperatae]
MFTLLFLLGLLLSPTSRPTSAATTLKLRKSSSRSPRILHSLRRNSPRSPQRGGWRGGGGAGGGGRGGRYANVVVVTQSAIEGGSVVETVSTTQAIGEGGWYGKGRGGLAGDLVTTSAEVAASDTEIVDDADWGGGRGRWRMNNVQTDADSRDTSSYVYASSTGDLTGSTTRWIDDADSWTDSMVSTSTLDIITSVYISSTSPTAISSPPTSSAVSSLPTSLSSSAVSSASAAPTTTSFSALSSSSTSSSISSSPTGPATVGLDSQNSQGITYTVEVVIDGKKMEVIADTGSSMLWVPTTGCPTCSSAGMTISSITLPDDCSEYEQKYGMGSAVGCRTNVTVSLGDLELEDLSILGVKSVDSILAQQGSFMSGIIGFALDAGTIGDSPTFVSQLYNSGKIDSPEVGFYLPRGANQDGSVTLGSAARQVFVLTLELTSTALMRMPIQAST